MFCCLVRLVFPSAVVVSRLSLLAVFSLSSFVADCSWVVMVSCLLSVVCGSLCVVCCLLFVRFRLWFVASCLRCACRCSLFVACCLLNDKLCSLFVVG